MPPRQDLRRRHCKVSSDGFDDDIDANNFASHAARNSRIGLGQPARLHLHFTEAMLGFLVQMAVRLAPRKRGEFGKPLVEVRLADGFSYEGEGLRVDVSDSVAQPVCRPYVASLIFISGY